MTIHLTALTLAVLFFATAAKAQTEPPFVQTTDSNCTVPRTVNDVDGIYCFEDCDPRKHNFSFSENDCKARNQIRSDKRNHQAAEYQERMAEKARQEAQKAHDETLAALAAPCVAYAQKSCKAVLVIKTNCQNITYCQKWSDGLIHCRVEQECDESYKAVCKGTAPKGSRVVASATPDLSCAVKLGDQEEYVSVP